MIRSNSIERRPAGRRDAGVRAGRSAVRVLAVAGLAFALAAAPGAAFAEAGAKGTAKAAGLGFASGICSLVYAPLKIVYATGGLIVGGMAWAFSGGDSEVAKVVFTPSLRGDYVVTPDHLTGDSDFEFFGREPVPGQERTEVAASDDGWAEGW